MENQEQQISSQTEQPQSPLSLSSSGADLEEVDEYNLDHEVPHNRFYLIKHILALFAGLASASLIVTGVGFLVDHIFRDADAPADAWLYFKGFAYTSLIASLLVFGAAYVVLYLFKRDKTSLPSDKSLRVGKTLTTIFAISMFAMSLSFAISFLYPILGSVLGLIDIKGNEIAKNMIIAAAGIIIPFFFAAYHIEAFAKIKKLVFAISVSSIILILVLLIIILPAGEVRNAVQDQKKVDDLDLIDAAISKYVDKNGSLPTTLKQITVKDLKNDISAYTLSVENNSTTQPSRYSYGYSSRLKYKLCADFSTNTLDDEDDGAEEGVSSYSFRYHKSGNYCFTRNASSSIETIYD